MSILKNRDFTPDMYGRLLKALKDSGYAFQTFAEYSAVPLKRVVILRHDVDRKPRNSLTLAVMEKEMGIRGSYHFRAVPSSNAPDIIVKIAGLGHEIAYHYEDLAFAFGNHFRTGGESPEETATRAFDSFRSNISYLRQYYPVNVISMHGSPVKKIDNRFLWKYFDYRECGIICEPYFDVDHSDMLYLTDTGRRWDGDRYNIRDKAFYHGGDELSLSYDAWKVRPVAGSIMNMTKEAKDLQDRFKIHSTEEIISLARSYELHGKILINTHPQRWDESIMPWINEYYMQSIKNQIKRIIIKFRSKSPLSEI